MGATVSKPTVNTIDVQVGRRVIEIRSSRGIDRPMCAAMAEIPVERLRLCECGLQRLRAAELFRLARALDVKISAFFRD